MGPIGIDALCTLEPSERVEFLQGLSPAEAEEYCHYWPAWARPTQLPPPGNWRVWMLQSGRGAGKTRTGAEYIRSRVEQGFARRIHIVGATAADVRDVMICGDSGILNITPRARRPLYKMSARRLEWPNGAVGLLFSAEQPDRLRGPQCDLAWADEVASWRRPEAWDHLLLGLRLGHDPRVVVTTTPRPTKLIKDLVASPMTHVTRESTWTNLHNLAPAFLDQILAKYKGTRLGRQEIEAEILDDVEGALWKHDTLDACRVVRAPDFRRIVVAVDPAITAEEGSDETGIIVVGIGIDGHGYVIDDCSGRYTPGEWARVVLGAYFKHKADRIVAEVNQGGDMVENTIRTIRDEHNTPIGQFVSYKRVMVSRGKYLRAEPVAALYEQQRVHHVGYLGGLEQQMTSWVPGERSPDRVDALVMGITELQVTHAPIARIMPHPI